MIAPDVLDLHGAAGELGVTYGWLQRNWRSWAGFPPPFKGGGKGERPLWALQALKDFKSGRRWAATEAPVVAGSAAYAPANDPQPTPHRPDLAALLAAAGG